jgi:hypothetical protein
MSSLPDDNDDAYEIMRQLTPGQHLELRLYVRRQMKEARRKAREGAAYVSPEKRGKRSQTP